MFQVNTIRNNANTQFILFGLGYFGRFSHKLKPKIVFIVSWKTNIELQHTCFTSHSIINMLLGSNIKIILIGVVNR